LYCPSGKEYHEKLNDKTLGGGGTLIGTRTVSIDELKSEDSRHEATFHPISSPKLLGLGLKNLKRGFSAVGTEADIKPLLPKDHKSAIDDDAEFKLDEHFKKMRWPHRAPFASAAFARKFHLVPVGEPMPFDILCGYRQETPDEKDVVELEQR